MYRFLPQLTQLGRTDSAVAKSKFTTVQIFPAVWAGMLSLMYVMFMG